eukprot:TRINITY_DN82825_c0_g1_i1.p1 TRINITY_DN82825_c0_g1~~TRINITY_DN82825_c0_g1_i1.p1  ORF type:complete len:220 (+),score=46.45 TRINITY_DN82825_c0_g1_i1:59-718(+)
MSGWQGHDEEGGWWWWPQASWAEWRPQQWSEWQGSQWSEFKKYSRVVNKALRHHMQHSQDADGFVEVRHLRDYLVEHELWRNEFQLPSIVAHLNEDRVRIEINPDGTKLKPLMSRNEAARQAAGNVEGVFGKAAKGGGGKASRKGPFSKGADKGKSGKATVAQGVEGVEAGVGSEPDVQPGGDEEGQGALVPVGLSGSPSAAPWLDQHDDDPFGFLNSS